MKEYHPFKTNFYVINLSFFIYLFAFNNQIQIIFHISEGLCIACIILTVLSGQYGEIVDWIEFSVEGFGCADDTSQSIHIKEAFQVCVPVYGVPGHTSEESFSNNREN